MAKPSVDSEHDLRPMRRNSLSGSTRTLTAEKSPSGRGILSSPFKKKKENVSKLWESKGNLVFGPKEAEKTAIDEARKSAIDKFKARVGSSRQTRRASLTHVHSPAPQTSKWAKSWRAAKPDKTADLARSSAVTKFRRASLSHVNSPSPDGPGSALQSSPSQQRRASLAHVHFSNSVASPTPSGQVQVPNQSKITAPKTPTRSAVRNISNIGAAVRNVLKTPIQRRRASLTHVQSNESVLSHQIRNTTVQSDVQNSPTGNPVQNLSMRSEVIQSEGNSAPTMQQAPQTPGRYPRPTSAQLSTPITCPTRRADAVTTSVPNSCPTRGAQGVTTQVIRSVKPNVPFAENEDAESLEIPKTKKKVIVRRVIVKRRIKKKKEDENGVQGNVGDSNKESVVVSRRIISSREVDTANTNTETPKRVVRYIKHCHTPGNTASAALVSPNMPSTAQAISPTRNHAQHHAPLSELPSKTTTEARRTLATSATSEAQTSPLPPGVRIESCATGNPTVGSPNPKQVLPSTLGKSNNQTMSPVLQPCTLTGASSRHNAQTTLRPQPPIHAGDPPSPATKQLESGAAEHNGQKLKTRITVKRVTKQWPKTPSMSLSPAKVRQEVDTEQLIHETNGLLLDKPEEDETQRLEENLEGCENLTELNSEGGEKGEQLSRVPSASNYSRLYEYARRCNWDKVAEECERFPRDAKCVGEKDGTTALHLAVMSRSNPSLRDSTIGRLRPAPLSLIEQLVIACPEAAIIRCSIKRYTPLIYACLVVDRGYNMKDASETVAILLHHAPHSAYVFTDEGFSALDIHILSYSRFYREREEVFSGGHTSTLVLQTLLTDRPDLAEARMYKNKVRGPIELLYRSNLEEFKDVGSGDGKLLERIGYLSSQSDWWAWKWVALLLKHAPRRTKRTNPVGPFTALHAAASLVGCPLPVLSIAANTYPKQLSETDPRGLLGNLPLHEVCSWVSDAEIICGDQFIQRRKALAIQCLMEEYPEAASVCNSMGETPLQLAIESCTPWDDGLDTLVEAYPEALTIPRSLRDCSDDNQHLLSRSFTYGDTDSVDSNWVDPLEAVEGMYPFMVAAVVAHVPDTKVNPPSFVFCDRSPEKRKDDLEKKEIESLRTVYGLLRANPEVLSMYRPGTGSERETSAEVADDSSNFTEVTCEDDEANEEGVFDEESTVEPLVPRADLRSL